MNTLPQLRTGNSLLFVDPRGGYQTALDLTATLALRESVRVLDFGNRFDVNHLTRPIRRHTPHVLQALARVSVTRAFTCYEATGLMEAQGVFLEETLNPISTPLLLLDILSPYMDEAVDVTTAFGLFRTTLQRIEQIQATSPVFITTRPAPFLPPERQGMYYQLHEVTQTLFITDETISPVTQLTLWEAA